MSKDKKHIGENLLEGIIELILTLFCLGIGVFIVGLFGVDLESLDIDYELITLLGAVASFILFVVIDSLVQRFKKKPHKKLT